MRIARNILSVGESITEQSKYIRRIENEIIKSFFQNFFRFHDKTIEEILEFDEIHVRVPVESNKQFEEIQKIEFLTKLVVVPTKLKEYMIYCYNRNNNKNLRIDENDRVEIISDAHTIYSIKMDIKLDE